MNLHELSSHLRGLGNHLQERWLRLSTDAALTQRLQQIQRHLKKIPAPNSIGRRLLLASLIVLPLYLASIGWFLSRSFEASQMTAALERYRVQFYALLGAVEFDSEGIKISPHTGDPRLRQFGSGFYAAIQRPRVAFCGNRHRAKLSI